ncbi:isoquinoline 1-oxidoreductase [Cupriavidus sp. UYMSc13B]|nr:isoquinoline 1-oxidoreductase [Cupriavidus sp. UYMSc13B]
MSDNPISVNGKSVEVRSDGCTPLLWVLRCELKLTGTKFGCGVGVCGACAVHVNGKMVLSCQHQASEMEGKKIVTIEGLDGPEVSALRAAWLKHEVVQCGYCQSAQLMAASALLKRTRNPKETEIADQMSCVICRCGTYTRIRRAIAEAAAMLRG